MIVFQNVSKIYNHNTIALDNVDFKVAPKEFVSFVGRSGAGKSTIIKLLTGEEGPTKGRIFFDNIEVNKLRPSKLSFLRRRIGIIFQEFRLLPEKNAYENVAFALEASGRPQSEIEEFVPSLFEMIGIKDKMHNFPRELSGGEKQRVAIARALINRPDVVIADEPTGNLDPINTYEIIKLLIKINELGTTLVLATHNKDIVNSLGKRVLVLDEGRLVRDEEQGRYTLS